MSITPQRVRQSNNVTPTSTTPKSLIKSGNWSAVFPTKIDTEVSSCVFVKKLITVAISNISYLRNMFPESAYANRSMDGLKLKILKSKSDCPEALNLARWLTGALDAIEKKYLRELMLVVYEDPSNPDVVRELYTFKFSYSKGKTSCQMEGGEGEGREKQALNITSDDIYKSTQNLLRTIVVLTQGLDHLPASMLTMKLTYYDAVTPADYEPAGFVPTPLVELVLPPGANNLGSGQVDTGFHSLQLKVMAAGNQKGREEKVCHVAALSQEAIQEVEENSNKNSEAVPPPSIDDDHSSSIPFNEQHNSERATVEAASSQPTLALELPSSSPASAVVDKPPISTSKSNISSVSPPVVPQPVKKTPITAVGRSPWNQVPDFPSVNSSVSLASSESMNILCTCSTNTVDSVMLTCSVCNYMQHAACYRIVYQSQAPESHVCVKCSIETGQTCTDPKLAKMKDNPGITNTCLFRRAIVFLTEVDAVSKQEMMMTLGVEENLALALLQKLGKECMEEEHHGHWFVKKEQLQSNVLPKYMGRKKIVSSNINIKGDVPIEAEVDGVNNGNTISEQKKWSKCSAVARPSLSQSTVTAGKGRCLVSEGEVNGNKRDLKKRKVSGAMVSLNI